ncbi:MAG: hypothetical protein LBE85_14035 [Candidatus Accumulibacter sp.]|jgi:hypothetical protein|nr:hypothetical protein [Accumulibacter sp.]
MLASSGMGCVAVQRKWAVQAASAGRKDATKPARCRRSRFLGAIVIGHGLCKISGKRGDGSVFQPECHRSVALLQTWICPYVVEERKYGKESRLALIHVRLTGQQKSSSG